MVSRKWGIHSGSVKCRELQFNDGNLTSQPKILIGTGAPTGIVAPIGSIYINYGASTSTTRLYINTDGSSTWAYFTTSA